MIHVPIPTVIEDVLYKVEHWPVSEQIGAGKLFPTFESLHVLAVGMLLGSLFMVDLRLLGLAARRYSVRRMSDELTPWTFGAFALALVTGLLLVIVHPTYYASNPAFVAKMVLLVLAGTNMLVFHHTIWRSVDGLGRWGCDAYSGQAGGWAIAAVLGRGHRHGPLDRLFPLILQRGHRITIWEGSLSTVPLMDLRGRTKSLLPQRASL